jgi:hypothetical protein
MWIAAHMVLHQGLQNSERFSHHMCVWKSCTLQRVQGQGKLVLEFRTFMTIFFLARYQILSAPYGIFNLLDLTFNVIFLWILIAYFQY